MGQKRGAPTQQYRRRLLRSNAAASAASWSIDRQPAPRKQTSGCYQTGVFTEQAPGVYSSPFSRAMLGIGVCSIDSMHSDIPSAQQRYKSFERIECSQRPRAWPAMSSVMSSSRTPASDMRLPCSSSDSSSASSRQLSCAGIPRADTACCLWQPTAHEPSSAAQPSSCNKAFGVGRGASVSDTCKTLPVTGADLVHLMRHTVCCCACCAAARAVRRRLMMSYTTPSNVCTACRNCKLSGVGSLRRNAARKADKALGSRLRTQTCRYGSSTNVQSATHASHGQSATPGRPSTLPTQHLRQLGLAISRGADMFDSLRSAASVVPRTTQG